MEVDFPHSITFESFTQSGPEPNLLESLSNPNWVDNSSYRRSFHPLEPCYRQSWCCYLVKNCADKATGPITQPAFQAPIAKLCRTYPLCGKETAILTQGQFKVRIYT